jgi:stage III sporulation protein AG
VIEEWVRGIYPGKGEEGNSQRKWSRYILVMVICIGMLALIWPMGKNQPIQVPETSSSGSVERAQQKMSRELEYILSQVEGAGQVRVSISLNSDGLKSYASNTKKDVRETVEQDNNGGDRQVREENVSSEIAVSGGSALLVEEKAPQITGVLVVADGADDPLVKEELGEATAALLNLSLHQIRVLPRKEE